MEKLQYSISKMLRYGCHALQCSQANKAGGLLEIKQKIIISLPPPKWNEVK